MNSHKWCLVIDSSWFSLLTVLPLGYFKKGLLSGTIFPEAAQFSFRLGKMVPIYFAPLGKNQDCLPCISCTWGESSAKHWKCMTRHAAAPEVMSKSSWCEMKCGWWFGSILAVLGLWKWRPSREFLMTSPTTTTSASAASGFLLSSGQAIGLWSPENLQALSRALHVQSSDVISFPCAKDIVTTCNSSHMMCTPS